MATLYGIERTAQNTQASGANPQTRVKANRAGGRIRFAEFTYNQGATASANTTDKVVMGTLPKGAKIIGHMSKLYWNAGTASCTMSVGDSIQAARWVPAATDAATAGSVLFDTNTGAIGALTHTTSVTTVTGSAVLTAVTALGGLLVGANIAGTGIPTGAVITAFDRDARTVTISAVATADGTVTATILSGGYECSSPTNSASNLFAATTDDCSIVIQFAAAVIKANQTFVAKVAYVLD